MSVSLAKMKQLIVEAVAVLWMPQSDVVTKESRDQQCTKKLGHNLHVSTLPRFSTNLYLLLRLQAGRIRRKSAAKT